MDRLAKIIVWARDRSESRAAVDPVQWLYGGKFTERGLAGLAITNDVGTTVGVHIFELAQISIRFLAHYLWDEVEVDGRTVEEDPAGILVALDSRRAYTEHNQEQLRKLRVAFEGHEGFPVVVLWQHDDAALAERLSNEESEALLEFGGIQDALVAHASKLGPLAAFESFCRSLAATSDLGAHYRVTATG